MEADDDEIEIRPWRPEDDAGIFELLTASLGWVYDDDHAAFFRWKHRENPFGDSPGWVATTNHKVVGFRSFLRWRFSEGDREVAAVRAVDTATAPTHQRRGIFKRLTLHGLDELPAQGVRFVFNTPNRQSRPGYLKMGWTIVGRVPVRVRLKSAAAPLKLVRARVPAKRWGLGTTAGVPAPQVLSELEALSGLLRSQPQRRGLSTARTTSYLAWRYGFEPLGYRAMLATDAVEDGVALFRLRQRGPALETVVTEVLVPGGNPRAEEQLLRRVARQTTGDFVLIAGGSTFVTAGFVPLPRTGPTLMWRPLTTDTGSHPPSTSAISMGDVELF